MQQVQECVGQGGDRDVVDGHGHLDAVWGQPPFVEPGAGVVDQTVDALGGCGSGGLCERSRAGDRAQIGGDREELARPVAVDEEAFDVGARRFRGAGVGQDGGSFVTEKAGGLVPDAALSGAGDQDGLAPQTATGGVGLAH